VDIDSHGQAPSPMAVLLAVRWKSNCTATAQQMG